MIKNYSVFAYDCNNYITIGEGIRTLTKAARLAEKALKKYAKVQVQMETDWIIDGNVFGSSVEIVKDSAIKRCLSRR